MENEGPKKSRGWKVQDWKLADEIAGLENAILYDNLRGQHPGPLGATI